MTSIKDQIIIGIAQLPKNNIAKQLQPLVGSDVHSIVHVLYGLNKQGLVGYKLNKKSKKDQLEKIYLTPKGKQYYERIS